MLTELRDTRRAERVVTICATFGELNDFSTSPLYKRVDAHGRERTLSAVRVYGLFSGVSALLPLVPALYVSSEIIRGADVTPQVASGVPKSLAQTLRVSG